MARAHKKILIGWHRPVLGTKAPPLRGVKDSIGNPIKPSILVGISEKKVLAKAITRQLKRLQKALREI